MKKRSFFAILVTILLLLSVVLVSAKIEYISATTQAVKDKVMLGENAQFKLYVTNEKGVSDKYRVIVLDNNWENIIDPYLFDIGGGDTKVVDVKLMPNEGTGFGKKSVRILINSVKDSGNTLVYSVIVDVLPYSKVIGMAPIVPKSVPVNEEFPFKIKLKNTGGVDLKGITVKVSSGFFADEKTVDLKSGGEVTADFLYDLNNVNAGPYKLTIELYYKGNLLTTKSEEFEILPITDIEEKTITEQSFLKNVIYSSKTNVGQKAAKLRTTITISPFERIFSSTKPKESSTIRTQEGVTYIWDYTLEPGKSYNVAIAVNYRPLILVVIAIILFCIFVCILMQRGVRVTKKVIKTRIENDSIFSLKVMLHVKNKSSSPIHDVKVFDIIPRVIHLDKFYSTIQPISTKKTEKGMEIIWDLGSLDKGEERVLSYHVDFKLQILGMLILPPAEVIYNLKRKLRETKSNEATILTPKHKLPKSAK